MLLGCLVLPPVASVVASAVGALSLSASLAVMIGADLTLLTMLLEITLQGRAVQHYEVTACKNDDEAVPYLIAHVVRERPRTVDMLEYSAFGALPLLAKLGEEGCTQQIRLLVAHPSAAISDYQRDYRLAEGLRALAYRIPADRARSIGLQLKCYSATASLRGRLLADEVLAVGWYSYDDRGLADPGGRPLSGASNSLVITTASSSGGQHLIHLYRRVFENLWRDAAEPDQAWEPYRDTLPHLPSADWLTSVRSRG
ncbi:hypothetical protein [Streptomyces sp. bgisy159]|uniref:hypothetical protein n=1 Tax=Streptomyces sp. bgisy159 TaxID=3413795 RepID=UPI003F4A4921